MWCRCQKSAGAYYAQDEFLIIYAQRQLIDFNTLPVALTLLMSPSRKREIMKNLKFLGAIALLIAQNSMAAGSAAVQYRGQAGSQQVQVTGREGHNLYEWQDVAHTCYEQVLDHYETRCHQESYEDCSGSQTVCEPSEVCRTENGVEHCTTVTRCHVESSCHTEYRQVCNEEPVYRDVAYTCYQREQVVVGYETDYNVKANITVNFDAAPVNTTPNESFEIQMNEGALTIRATDTSKQLLILETESSTEKTLSEDQGPNAPGEKEIQAVYNLSFRSVAELTSPIDAGLKDLELGTKELRFTTSKITQTDFLNINLFASRNQFLIGNKVKYNNDVPNDAIRLDNKGDQTQVVIDLKKIGCDVFSDAKYNIGLKLNLRDSLANSRMILNPSVLNQKSETKLDKRGLVPVKQ